VFVFVCVGCAQYSFVPQVAEGPEVA
jgi:hypothetical protein